TEENKVVDAEEWVPPVIKTIATEESGFPELIKAIVEHRSYLQKTGLLAQREHERLTDEFDHILRHTLVQNWKAQTSDEHVQQIMDAVYKRKRSPANAVEELTRTSN
ncbi:MAG: hypothetical protein CVU45_06710, partial [Chloroflexi bacterium HGW-Chloroflexi-7]